MLHELFDISLKTVQTHNASNFLVFMENFVPFLHFVHSDSGV